MIRFVPRAGKQCTHLELAQAVEPKTAGCEECLAEGGRWLHLRLCLICGHVGCCDQSKGQHATKHYHATQHPLIRSFESGEAWAWCFVDRMMLFPTQERSSSEGS
jgi:uncharacterized UBP type Zn finger protein